FQLRIEDVVIEMCNYLYKKTKTENLCLSGGCAMNSKMNGRVQRETPFKHVFVQSSSDDGGASYGACFYWWNSMMKKPRSFQIEHDYWGPGYSDQQIEKAIKDALLDYRKCDHVEEEAAKRIAKGEIVGWFQGRMEYGQRALGNRSILADPRDPGMKDKINTRVKHREKFRPFAPSILEEYTGEFFDQDIPVPFMQKVYLIREEKRKLIPSVTHIDGSGRLQTVSKKTNERYWNLINEFKKISGIPIVLNTSFNDNDEPIVMTPKDALRCFFSTGIDVLFMGDYIIEK
ncbi:MAG: carbamoyltransferase, partial [Spirochaetes bacterium]|nr:carbamoyltransferase [Spirochaetota bacterium]